MYSSSGEYDAAWVVSSWTDWYEGEYVVDSEAWADSVLLSDCDGCGDESAANCSLDSSSYSAWGAAWAGDDVGACAWEDWCAYAYSAADSAEG